MPELRWREPGRPSGLRCCGTALVVEGSEIRKTVTVLVSDVTGSTSLGECLDSESLRSLNVPFYLAVRKDVTLPAEELSVA